ncbi:Transcriptional regulator, ArsR family [hydrothermal vent metagenome]|uniref:Transcriptional regulator, ArsR family n=1 Tax=hydrothermal vent metagenome TaxID=652676 RepID=A0A3B0W0X3_9ZZZZ
MEEMLIHSGPASDLLKLISNQKRLLILCLLHEKEMSVSELNDTLSQLSQSALSQHLAQLREANLVKVRRDAQTIYYSLTDSKAVQVIHLLHELYCQEECPTD